MPCFTYKSRLTDVMPFSDDEMTPCHILLSPTGVRGAFMCPEIAPRETSSAEIVAETSRVSLVLFYNIRHDFYVKSSAIGQSGTILVASRRLSKWKPRIQYFLSNHMASKMWRAPYLLITVIFFLFCAGQLLRRIIVRFFIKIATLRYARQ